MTTGAAILCIENVRLFIELLGLSGDSTTSVDMGLANWKCVLVAACDDLSCLLCWLWCGGVCSD